MFSSIINITVGALCDKHYQLLYRESHEPKICAGCGAKPKSRQAPYSRVSPYAISVSKYLNERTDLMGSVGPSDVLCKSCYDMHLLLLEHINTKEPHLQLQASICQWKLKMEDKATDKLTKAVLRTVIFVAKVLQQEKALLLPKVVSVFMDIYSPEDKGELYLELAEGDIKFSAKWLLKQLIIYLQPYMNYRCIIKKTGYTTLS